MSRRGYGTWLGRGAIPLLLIVGFLSLQAGSRPARPQVPPTQERPPAPGTERIYLVPTPNYRVLKYDQRLLPNAQIIVGDVIFSHNDIFMYCDSAHLFETENRFEAFGNVRINQGDSLHIYCNFLDYDGRTQLARLRELVRMEHGENTLFTDSLDYNRVNGVGYYFDHGTIVDSLNILSSVYGEYMTTTKVATFNDRVVLENPNFTMYSDTLKYDTNTKLAYIYGPTRIVGDSGVINATRGTYDTEQDLAYLMDRAVLESGTKWMTGDSLYYDRNGQIAEMHGDIILRDTLEQVELRGHYAEYNEATEHGLARDSAYVVEYSSTDTLYAHALLMEMIKVDSLTSLVKGVDNVRLFRKDVQAVSDTLIYNSRDSVVTCLGQSFIWSGASQITGDTISMYMQNGELHHAHIRENAYLTNEVDSDGHYDQMRGRELFAYFSDSEMDSVWMHGNAEVIYYNLSKDSLPQEQIKTQSSALMLQFIDEYIFKIKLLDKTIGTMTPVPLLSEEELVYPDFFWFPQARPKNFKDIFRRTPAKGDTAVTEENDEEITDGDNGLLSAEEAEQV